MSKIGTKDQAQEQIGVVFIHGAGLESRIWEQVSARLNRPCLLADFPNREGRKGGEQLALADYIAHINKQIEEWGVKRFILVAHSLGGVLALKIACDWPDRLVGLAAVGAIVPKRGGSFLSTKTFIKRILMRILLRLFGTKPSESAIRKGLCNDLTAEQADAVVRGYFPESLRLYTDPVGAPVPSVPKLYVKLEHDRELKPSEQDKMIANLAPQQIERLKSGHLPMISKPDELSHAIHSFVYRVECSL